ncbi:hypothetical protein ACFZBE_40440 [Streptomyces sp. NPDC008061]|uniref:hypothetical protein n=1 Tax=Streptomyces sp. NPDC008061 TaxID=3364805 RepID=UPI0036E971D8
MNRSMLSEICFKFANGRQVDLENITVADFDRFMEHVNKAGRVFREIIVNPPKGMKAGTALRAAALIGSHKIEAHSADRDELDALIARRHDHLSTARTISLGNLTATVLAIQRRLGTKPGLEKSVELTASILEHLFPEGLQIGGSRDSETVDLNSVENQLVPGGTWSSSPSIDRVVEALRQAGPASVALLLHRGVQKTDREADGNLQLLVNLGQDAQTGRLQIAYVDPRSSLPIEALSDQWWALDSAQVRIWVEPGTQMMVIDGRGRVTDPAALPEYNAWAAQQERAKASPAGALDAFRRPGSSRDTDQNPTRLPLGHVLVVDRPRAGGVIIEAEPATVAVLNKSGKQPGKRAQFRSWTHFELPDANRPQAWFGYDVSDAGDIRFFSSRQIVELPADGWTAYGDDFVHLTGGVLLRGDTGWIARIDNWTLLHDSLSDPQATHTVRCHGGSIYLLPLTGMTGRAIRLPLIRPLSDTGRDATMTFDEQHSPVRPFTERSLLAVALTARRVVGVGPGLENCVDLTEVILRSLFPTGIRTGTSQEDLVVGSGRTQDRLVPGGTWSPLTSMDQLVGALRTAGPGTIAVLMEQSNKAKGHVNLHINLGPDRHPRIVRVDPHADHPVEALSDNWQQPNSTDRAIHAGRGTRIILIDPTGQTIHPTTHPDNLRQPQSTHTTHTLTHPPTSTNYAGLGVEVERNNQEITTNDGSRLEYGTLLAHNVNSGIRLTVDQSPIYTVNGWTTASWEAATAATVGGDRPGRRSIAVLEVVSPPHAILPGEDSKYVSTYEGWSDHWRTHELLDLPTTKNGVVPLSELLPKNEGWKLEPEAHKVLVHPATGIKDHPFYAQFTVGANIGGASFIIALAQDRNYVPFIQIALRKSRKFASDITTSFANWRLGREVTVPELPFLFAVVPDLLQMDAYAWLMFNHASAIPLQVRFHEKYLTKNMLPAALRTPFHSLRESLSLHVQSFLARNEKYISNCFEIRLLEAVSEYEKSEKILVSTASIMREKSHKGVEHKTYLSSMVLGTRVAQFDTVGMHDYSELDEANGQLPLALFELRMLARGMDSAMFNDTVIELRDLANRAHAEALRFERWEDAWTPRAVSRVIEHPLVRQMKDLLPHLASLRVPDTSGRSVRLFTHLDRLTIAAAFADHAAFARPLPPEVIERLHTANAKVAQAMAPESPLSAKDREIYKDGTERFQALLRTLPPASAASAASAASGQQSMHIRPRAFLGAPRAMRAPRAPGGALVPNGLGVKAGRGLSEQTGVAIRHIGDVVPDQDTLENTSASATLRPSYSGVVVSSVGVDSVPGWGVARAGAVPLLAERVWVDPVSQPEGTGGVHAWRYVVRSGFDVRSFEVEGRSFTDLTVRVELTAGQDVSLAEADIVWERALAGVETVYNRPGQLLPDDSVLHVTLERVPPGTDAHLQVTAVTAGSLMDQEHWPVDATAHALAHETGHQLGLRDEYKDPTAPHRPEADGSIMGNWHLPAPEGLPQAALRRRHLHDIHTQTLNAHNPKLAAGSQGRGPRATRSGLEVAPRRKNKGPLKEPLSHGISDITRPSHGEPTVLPHGTQHDSPAAPSQEHAAQAPRLAPTTPTPIEARATGQDGVALGALWRESQEADTLLPVSQTTTKEVEIRDFLPHELKAEVDALARRTLGGSTPQELEKHQRLVTKARARLVNATEHAVRIHLANDSRGLLNTALSYTFEGTGTNFQNEMIVTQLLATAFKKGITVKTGHGKFINLCA